MYDAVTIPQVLILIDLSELSALEGNRGNTLPQVVGLQENNLGFTAFECIIVTK